MNPSYAMLLYLSSIDPIRLWFEIKHLWRLNKKLLCCAHRDEHSQPGWTIFPSLNFPRKGSAFKVGGGSHQPVLMFRILQISLAPRAIFRIYCIYLGKHDTCQNWFCFWKATPKRRPHNLVWWNYYELSLLLGCLPTKCAPTSCKWN